MKTGIINKKTISLMACLSFAFSLAQAQTVNASTVTTKASAILAASCIVSADNVNLGNLNVMALQSGITATSNMNVLCTTGSSYTINLAYGGVYGQGGSNSGDYYKITNSQSYCNKICGTNYYLTEYDSGGNVINTLTELNPAGGPYAPSGTVSNGNGEYVASNPAYAYGMLTGAMSGDHIQYAITVPGNNSEIWNAGNYSYSSTGTGANQTFPIRATVTGSYPTPDSYSDTVTASVNF